MSERDVLLEDIWNTFDLTFSRKVDYCLPLYKAFWIFWEYALGIERVNFQVANTWPKITAREVYWTGKNGTERENP